MSKKPTKNQSSLPSICLLTLAYPSQANLSHGHFIEKQAQALKELGHPVVVVAPRTYFIEPLFSQKKGVVVYSFPYLSGNKRFGEYSRIPFLTLLTFFLSGIWQTIKVVKQEKCSLIQSHWVIPTGVIGLAATSLLKKPLLVTVHGSDLNVYLKKSRLAFWLARKVFQKSSLIIAVSSDLKKKIIEKFPTAKNKVKVVPTGIDTSLFSPAPKSKARKLLNLPLKSKIILFVGSLAEVKGFEVLKKALPDVFNSIPEAFLVMIGRIEPEKLKNLCKQLQKEGLKDRIIFTGSVSPSKMPFWLNASDLVAVPSLSEGLGLIAIEALSCQTPVVASATGELPKIVKNTNGGLLFQPGNFTELSQKIVQLLRKEKKSKVKINRKFIEENYDLKANTLKLSTFISQIINPEASYDFSYYQQLKKEYETSSRWAKDRIKNVLNLLPPIKKGDKVLDLGCGIGTFTIELSKLGASVTAIDSSEEALKAARKLFALYGQGKAKFIRGNANRLPFKKKFFDLVICADLVEHLSQKDYLKMLDEVKKVLKPGGRLLIYTPCPSHLFEIMRKQNIILKKDPTHIGLKTPEEIVRSLKSKNFAIEKLYFAPSHLVFFRNLEKIFSFLPLVGKFFRRRTCILARRESENGD